VTPPVAVRDGRSPDETRLRVSTGEDQTDDTGFQASPYPLPTPNNLKYTTRGLRQ